MKSLREIKKTLLDCLTEAGSLIRRSLKNPKVIQKKTELSIVTATDKAAEALILKKIGRHFPDHAILTEESPPMGSSHCRWIIDPLDGTTNFAHSYPLAAVSIAFEEDGDVKIGGVYDPFRDELFLAEKGGGATMNRKPIQVSKTQTVNDALFATGFPYDRRERGDMYLQVFKPMMLAGQGIRRTGAAAVDLCYVACGRFDAYWEFQLQPWDKAAGMLIVREAGGRITNFSGEELTLTEIQNLASNGILHESILKILEPYKTWR